ncbi:MAG: MBL fold metallo-hydrolase [Lachnospiraceae bacterium]|jgi:L-ascorbate metabolism protein UlaG (beta-lactamase superfamily)
MAQILYQGHSSFRLISDSGLVFYIDPYKGEGYDIPADVILVTHGHFDHNRIDIVEKKPDCTIITEREAVHEGEYNCFEINDVFVEAVPAYNHFHKKEECAGYIIDVDGRRLYFPGDTGITDEMKDYKDREIDVFFVPMDGIFTMDIHQAKEAAELVGAKYCVPIHTAPQHRTDEDLPYLLSVAEEFDGSGKVIIKPGENMVL